MKIEIFIIVPARSGSKGIADKNIRPLSGQPLLLWTAKVIQQAAIGQSLAILSTDSEIYAALGKEGGLQAPFLRNVECSGDTASAFCVVEHACQWFKDYYSYLPESIMWLQPTSPFRIAGHLHQAVSALEENQADAVIGCQEIHRDLTTLFTYQDNFLCALNKNQITQTVRQQVKPLLTPNGAIYLCRTARLLESKTFFPEKTVPLLMNKIQSLDIDTEEDWAMAEAFIRQGLVRRD